MPHNLIFDLTASARLQVNIGEPSQVEPSQVDAEALVWCWMEHWGQWDGAVADEFPGV